MSLYYIEIKKPNGMKNYYGVKNTEVFPSKGKVDEEDAAAAYKDKVSAAESVEQTKKHCEDLGILVSEGAVVEFEAQ
ncbi:MAG: hypothetical protein J6M17_11020 [Ruminococcus sp.]|nr:hypothetical protein [Ruminococcus sp.]